MTSYLGEPFWLGSRMPYVKVLGLLCDMPDQGKVVNVCVLPQPLFKPIYGGWQVHSLCGLPSLHRNCSSEWLCAMASRWQALLAVWRSADTAPCPEPLQAAQCWLEWSPQCCSWTYCKGSAQGPVFTSLCEPAGARGEWWPEARPCGGAERDKQVHIVDVAIPFKNPYEVSFFSINLKACSYLCQFFISGVLII